MSEVITLRVLGWQHSYTSIYAGFQSKQTDAVQHCLLQAGLHFMYEFRYNSQHYTLPVNPLKCSGISLLHL